MPRRDDRSVIEFLPILACVVLVLGPALYWLVRKDGLAIEAVTVDEADFAAGRLPPVCCKTGKSADVGATIKQQRWFRTVAEGIVPITNDQRDSFQRFKRRNRRSRVFVLVMFAAWVPFALARVPQPVEVAFVVIALGGMAMATVSNLMAHRCLAEPRREKDGSITLRGVHPAFVLVVQESRRDARPATIATRP